MNKIKLISRKNARSWKHAKGGQLIPKHQTGNTLEQKAQKAALDKEKYAKYNVATMTWDENGYLPSMNLPEVSITTDSPETEANKKVLLNHGYTQEDLENPNIKAHLPALANMLRNYDINGVNYLKGIGAVGLGLAGILTGGSGIGLAGALGREGVKQGAKTLGRKALRFGVDAGVGAATDYASNKAIQGLSNGEYEGFGDLMNRGVFNGSKDDVLKPMLWDMANPLGIATGIGTDLFLNSSNLGRALQINDTFNRGIYNATRHGDIRVTQRDLRAPDRWYRFVDRPEVGTIEELGMNVTSTDAAEIPSMSNNFRINTINNDMLKDNIRIARKLGSAHGNMSQASAKQLWTGTIAGNNDLFKHGVLTGILPKEVYKGLNRRVYYKTDVDNINIGDRIGFPTGEMPIEGLRYFEKIPGSNKYKYQGEVIPHKTEYVIGQDNPFYTDRVQFVSNGDYTNPAHIHALRREQANVDNSVNLQIENDKELQNQIESFFIPRMNFNSGNAIYSDIMLKKGFVPIKKYDMNKFNSDLGFTSNLGGWYNYNKGHIIDLNLDKYDKTHEYSHAFDHKVFNNLDYAVSPSVRSDMRNYHNDVNNFMTGKYTYNLEDNGFDIREFDADTRALRLKLFDDLHIDPTKLNIKEQNQIISELNDDWLSNNLQRISGYGSKLFDQIKSPEDFKKIKQLIIRGMQILPAASVPIMLNKNE